jgi:hypothetical protein
MSDLHQRIDMEWFLQMVDLVQASAEFTESLPGEMKWDTIRRSLRRYEFFNTPMTNDRDLLFLYQLRYGDDPARCHDR